MRKFIFAVMFFMLLFAALAGCGAKKETNQQTEGSPASDNQEATEQKKTVPDLQPLLEISEEKNNVVVTYKVKNRAAAPKKLTFPSGLEADYILYDGANGVIKKYSDELYSTQAIKEQTLASGETLTKQFELPPLVNGSYKIEVHLAANEEKAKVVKEFTVEHLQYQAGSGKLSGQADPHTVEIEQDGKITAYQLSEQAQQEILELKDGTNVTFIYLENQQGQRTIQSFLKK
ncbi:BsuPI-related putative proteinase inhibitor [Bacillus rubiinfantis]|uniref:BsuPI-related putative proteinase inhibitor n=1 Tax=Bacillus rubiinfantis TaxID=1499680 RepID=UPI0005AACE2F|nr:BsuPI-related putative proteinase inhibitor [Bacillus rubiinfantis]